MRYCFGTIYDIVGINNEQIIRVSSDFLIKSFCIELLLGILVVPIAVGMVLQRKLAASWSWTCYVAA